MTSGSVLHVSKTSNGGRFIGFQLPHLVESGIDVHLAVPGPGVLMEMANDAGARVHVLPKLESRNPLSAGGSLAKLIDHLEPDLVHTHFVHSTLATRFARKLTKRDFVNLFQVPGPLHLEQGWSRSLDIYTAGERDQWGAACQWSRNAYIQAGVPEGRVHLTYYGKNIQEYRAATDPTSLIRDELGFTEDDFVATMVAHIYKPRMAKRRGVKGHEDFLEAISIARRSDPAIKGLVVGGPRPGAEKYFRQLLHLSGRLNGSAVTFIGPRDDVRAIYSATEVAVHPSLSENIGGAGESLLMAVPTISTNVGGFTDVVKQEVTGLTVPPRSPEELAAAIIATKNNMVAAKERALRGRAIMQTVGNARNNAERIVELYKQMGVKVE